jgi:hypothetical protein
MTTSQIYYKISGALMVGQDGGIEAWRVRRSKYSIGRGVEGVFAKGQSVGKASR